MRGISAQSQRAVLDQLESLVRSGADLPRIGTELFFAASVLDGSAALRRAFTDPAAGAQLKHQLVGQLFGEKVDAATLECLSKAVELRWSRPRDLVDALERCGVEALVADAERDGTLDNVEDELFRFERIVDGDRELQYALTNRMPVAAKRELLGSLLRDKASPVTVSLVQQAAAGRYRSFAAALVEFERLAAARRQRLIATVRVAHPLDEPSSDRLADALSRRYGGRVHLNVIVDPDVLGGVRVEIGDEVVDGTVATRLEDVRRRIAG